MGALVMNMPLNNRIGLLETGQIAGGDFYNRLARALKYLECPSSLISLNVNPSGGLVIDLDIASLASTMGGHIIGSLVTSASGNTVSVTAGKVAVIGLNTVLSVSSASFDMSASGHVWLEITSSAASVNHGTMLPAHFSNVPTLYVPLADIAYSDGTCSVSLRHVGDLVIAAPPEWIPGYSANARQLLGHDANGDLLWYTPNLC